MGTLLRRRNPPQRSSRLLNPVASRGKDRPYLVHLLGVLAWNLHLKDVAVGLAKEIGENVQEADLANQIHDTGLEIRANIAKRSGDIEAKHLKGKDQRNIKNVGRLHQKVLPSPSPSVRRKRQRPRKSWWHTYLKTILICQNILLI